MKARCFAVMLMVTGLSLAMWSSAGMAQDKAAPGKDAEVPKVTDSKETTATLDVIAAYRLAKWGRDNKSPEALLAAARVIGTTKFQDIVAKDEKAGDFETLDAVKEATALVDEAVKVGKENANVKALATALLNDIAEKSRGAAFGPQTRYGTVGINDRRDTFIIRFRGGERAHIYVNNVTNRGDIDLFVLNESGQVVARDRRGNDDAHVDFWVPRSQNYTVIVHCYRTGGASHLRYRLTTN